MKRMLIALLCLALASVLAAHAEEATLPENAPLSVDLDGDGAAETVSWVMVPGEYETSLTLTVTTAAGTPLVYATDIVYREEVYILDLDGDGRQEILLTGDMMSEDFCTVCLRYADGELYELVFADVTRGENNYGYTLYGYGRISAIDGNSLTLTGSQDVLGTWFASRTFTLTSAGRFELADSGLWVRDMSDIDDEMWQYVGLTVTAPIDYYDDADNYAGTLQPGDQLMVTASDKDARAWFVTRGGQTGMLRICWNYMDGWGWMVNDVPEDQLFEYVPYAD